MLLSHYRFILATVVALSIMPIMLFAQNDVLVLLKGNIAELGSGAPMEAEMNFREESGNLVRAKSNRDGSYQQILKPGHTYLVTFSGQNIVRETQEIQIPAVEKYTEIQKNFTVRPMKPGVELYKGLAFEIGGENLAQSAEGELTDIKELLSKNRGMTIKIAVFGDSHDDNALGSRRLSVVQNLFAGVKNGKKRVVFVNDVPFPPMTVATNSPPPPPVASKKDKKKQNVPPPPPVVVEAPKPTANVVIILGEQLNLFD